MTFERTARGNRTASSQWEPKEETEVVQGDGQPRMRVHLGNTTELKQDGSSGWFRAPPSEARDHRDFLVVRNLVGKKSLEFSMIFEDFWLYQTKY